VYRVQCTLKFPKTDICAWGRKWFSFEKFFSVRNIIQWTETRNRVFRQIALELAYRTDKDPVYTPPLRNPNGWKFNQQSPLRVSLSLWDINLKALSIKASFKMFSIGLRVVGPRKLFNMRLGHFFDVQFNVQSLYLFLTDPKTQLSRYHSLSSPEDVSRSSFGNTLSR
jgi:hypothetical protein